MILRLGTRAVTELSPKILWKMVYLYMIKGFFAIQAYKSRRKKGELFPPFMFVALTNICNLRCKGCWVEKEGTAYHMEEQDLDYLIQSVKKAKSHYVTLLGGEPFMHKNIWSILEKYPECYFQVITNGMLFTESNVAKLKKLGNITPLISVDGWKENNDERRGEGVFNSLSEGIDRLQKAKIFYGIATTISKYNLDEVLSDKYLETFISKGALYIWYYVTRPVGEGDHSHYCLSEDELVEVRKRLLVLRRKHPIVIIDTYWTAEGEAFCPAAMGLGYHIGPRGSIEICPPLSFATDTLKDNGGDVQKTLASSQFLGGFEKFVNDRTKGCVILEHPQELVSYIKDHGALDYSGRDALAEIDSITPRHSHHLPGKEIPEDYWVYKFIKKNVFFGMGAGG